MVLIFPRASGISWSRSQGVLSLSAKRDRLYRMRWKAFL